MKIKFDLSHADVKQILADYIQREFDCDATDVRFTFESESRFTPDYWEEMANLRVAMELNR